MKDKMNDLESYESEIEELNRATTRLIKEARSSKDIRMAKDAVADLADAARTLEPYDKFKKATIFGSARVTPDSRTYNLAFEMAKYLAEEGFIVVTGGGPGVMEAGLKGVGSGIGVGIAIELPFEAFSDEKIKSNGWPVSKQRLFFTRKLSMVRHIQAFIAAPGGYGTLDELFEVLTLLQTGKSKPAPVILLEDEANPMWSALVEFINSFLVPMELINPIDAKIMKVTSDPKEAIEHIKAFYKNFDSLHQEEEMVTINYKSTLKIDSLEAIAMIEGVNGVVTDYPNVKKIIFKLDLRKWVNLYKIIEIINA